MKPEAAPWAPLLRWLSNPVLAEWSQSIPWCDLRQQQDHQAFLRLARILAFRAVPLGVALLLLGFWSIGKIPQGGGPVPRGRQLLLALPLLALAVPYILLRLGLIAPQPGTSVRARLRVRTIELVGRRGMVRVVPWSAFDAFDFGSWEGFDLLKLRLRQRWWTRGRRWPAVLAVEIGQSGVDPSKTRQILLERGLREESLALVGSEWGTSTCRGSP